MDSFRRVTGIEFTPERHDRRPGDPARIVASGAAAARDLGLGDAALRRRHGEVRLGVLAPMTSRLGTRRGGVAEARARSDGLELRAIRLEDVDQTADLLAERGDAADAEDLRLVLDDPSAGLEGTAVVVDGGRVVATASLLDEHLEMVAWVSPQGRWSWSPRRPATRDEASPAPSMDWCHDRSAARGHWCRS